MNSEHADSRNSRARAWRRFLAALIILAGLLLFWCLYSWRVAEMTCTLSGPEL